MASSSLSRRHLVVGGDAVIGRALWQRLGNDGVEVWASTRRPDLIGPDRPFIDLVTANWSDLDDLPISAETTVHICAAAARIAQCAADPEGTRRVNVEGPVALATALAARGAHILFLSTNQVLPGDRPLASADTPYGGATEYGRQKAEAEQRLLALDAPVAVLRLAKVLTEDDPLISGWRRDLKAGRAIRPFHDMTAAPVSAVLVVEAMIRIAVTRGKGLFQLSAKRDVSYADLALHLARSDRADPSLINPGTVSGAGLPHRPPPFTSLDGHRLAVELGLSPPDPFDAILADHRQGVRPRLDR